MVAPPLPVGIGMPLPLELPGTTPGLPAVPVGGALGTSAPLPGLARSRMPSWPLASGSVRPQAADTSRTKKSRVCIVGLCIRYLAETQLWLYAAL
jgi:hypothetical protein